MTVHQIETVEYHTKEQHSRLNAMTKILMETLEEQGVLRALLQHTGQDNTLNNVDFEKGNQPNLETRYRGTMLELEKTVQKVALSITFV